MPRGTHIDPAILQAAVEGLEHRLAEVNEKLAAVRKLLRAGNPAPAAVSKPGRRPRRKMSAAARKRISVAQRKRWAQFRAKSAPRKKGRAAASSAAE